MDQPMRNRGDWPWSFHLASCCADCLALLIPFLKHDKLLVRWHCWRKRCFSDVLHGLPPWSLLVNRVTDGVCDWCGPSNLLWCFCTRQVANQTPNQSCSALLDIGSMWNLQKSSSTRSVLDMLDLQMQDWELLLWVDGLTSVDHQNLWMPLWMPLSQHVYHTVSRGSSDPFDDLWQLQDPPLSARHPDGLCMARLNQPGRFTVTTF